MLATPTSATTSLLLKQHGSENCIDQPQVRRVGILITDKTKLEALMPDPCSRTVRVLVIFALIPTRPAREAGVDVLNLSNQGINGRIAVEAYITGDEQIGLTNDVYVAVRIPAPPTLE